ncbi:hypothetical protein ABPG73_005410 [Tetrahymena malaccensis]
MNIDENRFTRQFREYSQLYENMPEKQRQMIEEPEENNSEDLEEQKELNVKIQITKNGKVLQQHETKDLSYKVGAQVRQNFTLTKQQIFREPYPQVNIIIINNDNNMQINAVGNLIDVKPNIDEMARKIENILLGKEIQNNNKIKNILKLQQKFYFQLDYKSIIYENKKYLMKTQESTDLISKQIAEESMKNLALKLYSTPMMRQIILQQGLLKESHKMNRWIFTFGARQKSTMAQA